MEEEFEKLLEAKDVARILNVTLRTVYRYVEEKKISHIRMGGKRIRFSRSDIEDFIKRSRVVRKK